GFGGVEAGGAGAGTGGPFRGAGARVRESFPDVVVAAAEPLPGDPVMGLRSLDDGYVPPILDVAKLDRKLLVSNDEAVAGVHALLEREGIFAGVSSGAVLHVGRRLAGELGGGLVVCVLADRRLESLSARFRQGEDIDESQLWWQCRSLRARRSPSTPDRSCRTKAAASWCCATASPIATSRAATPPSRRIASSSRLTPSSGSSRTKAGSSPSSTRTSRRRRVRRAPMSRTSGSGRAGRTSSTPLRP